MADEKQPGMRIALEPEVAAVVTKLADDCEQEERRIVTFLLRLAAKHPPIVEAVRLHFNGPLTVK